MHATLGIELAIVGGFLLLALGLVVSGVVQLVLSALALKKRADRFKELPILATIAETQARVENTVANLEKIDRLMTRAQAALAEIDAAKERVMKIGRTVAFVARTAFAVASGISAMAGPRNGGSSRTSS